MFSERSPMAVVNIGEKSPVYVLLSVWVFFLLFIYLVYLPVSRLGSGSTNSSFIFRRLDSVAVGGER